MITDIEVAELLKTYGDALTEAHPSSPAAEDFTTNAEQTGPLLTNSPTGATDAIDNIVAIADQPRHRGRRVLAAAVVVLLAGLAAFGAWTGLRATETVSTTGVPNPVEGTADIPVEAQPFVLPGEIVLRTDPLVVIAAPPPMLNFDTSSLGTEIEYEEIASLPQDVLNEEIQSALDAALWTPFDNIELEVRKLTLLWHQDGRVFAVALADGVVDESQAGSEPSLQFAQAGATVRFERIVEGGSGGGGAGVVDDPDDPAGFQIPETVEEHLDTVGTQGQYPIIGGSSIGGDQFSLEYEVAQEVAIVQMIVGDAAVWTRPVAGQALLSGPGSESTQIELVTYNSDGEELTRRLATVEGG